MLQGSVFNLFGHQNAWVCTVSKCNRPLQQTLRFASSVNVPSACFRTVAVTKGLSTCLFQAAFAHWISDIIMCFKETLV